MTFTFSIELFGLNFYALSVPRWIGQVEKARKYNMITLAIGTSIRRLNHLEYPAFVKMNQNGMTTKAANISIIIAPEAPMYIGMSPIVSGIAFSFRMVCCGLLDGIRHPVKSNLLSATPTTLWLRSSGSRSRFKPFGNARYGSIVAGRTSDCRMAACRRKPTFVKGVHLLSQTIFE